MTRALLIAALMAIAASALAQTPPPYNPVPFPSFVNTAPPASLPLGSNDNIPVIQGGITKRAPGTTFTAPFSCPVGEFATGYSVTAGWSCAAGGGATGGAILAGGDATSCILVGGDATSCILAN